MELLWSIVRLRRSVEKGFGLSHSECEQRKRVCFGQSLPPNSDNWALAHTPPVAITPADRADGLPHFPPRI